MLPTGLFEVRDGQVEVALGGAELPVPTRIDPIDRIVVGICVLVQRSRIEVVPRPRIQPDKPPGVGVEVNPSALGISGF